MMKMKMVSSAAAVQDSLEIVMIHVHVSLFPEGRRVCKPADDELPSCRFSELV